MPEYQIKMFEPEITDDDRRAVSGALAMGRIGPGVICQQFEEALCEATGKKYCVLTNSGTTALLLCMDFFQRHTHSWGVQVPAIGMHAAAEAAALMGLSVRAYDEYPDAPFVKESDEQYVYINQNGLPHPTAAPDLEDACQSLGIPGAFNGFLNTLSFSVPKVITSSQGGAVLTDHEDVAQEIRNLTDHGGDWRKTRIHKSIGGNFRMPDVLAALGLSQLKRLPDLLQARRMLHEAYKGLLSPERVECGWCVVYRSQRGAELVEHLAKHGIEATQPYRPITHHAPFAHLGVFENAEREYRERVYLPSRPNMSVDDVLFIADRIKEFENE